jgi:hypothetical protein
MGAVEIKNVPVSATRFGGPCELSIGDKVADGKTSPVELLARSAEAVEHPYWGRVVHDFDGMKLSKPRLLLDWCHYSGEVLGFLDRFEVRPEGLFCFGALVPYVEGDKAAEVAFKSAAGVPYESSINFNGTGIKIEDVGPGESVQVNGREFVGPGVVIREWPLRGVALCPFGADQFTAAEFADDGGDVAVAVTRPAATAGNPGGGGIVRFASGGIRAFSTTADEPAPNPAANVGRTAARGIVRMK